MNTYKVAKGVTINATVTLRSKNGIPGLRGTVVSLLDGGFFKFRVSERTETLILHLADIDPEK